MSKTHRSHYLVGASSAIITPDKPIPMAGFGSRGDKPSEGVCQDIYLKVLALSDSHGKAGRLAIVTGDLAAFSTYMVKKIRKGLKDRLGLGPESIMLNASHTHCGPKVREDKEKEYTNFVINKAIDLVEEAFSKAVPARIYFGRGECDMSASRRCRDRNGYFIRGINPYGHTDKEVGILKITRANGRTLAILFNYSCHPTSTGGFKISGDWAGFAHRFVEKQFSGATAIFMQGCGGDLKVPVRHKDDPFRFGYYNNGREAAKWARILAKAVLKGLKGPMEEITGKIVTKRAMIKLPLVTRIDDTDPAAKPFQAPRRRMARLAKSMLLSLDAKGKYKKTKPYELTVARIGQDFLLVALCGEAAVRIGLRIKEQLIPRPVIVGAYMNAIQKVGYLPSADMIPEEGYEAYTPYSLEAEDFLVDKVMSLAGRGRTRPRDVSAPLRKRAPGMAKTAKLTKKLKSAAPKKTKSEKMH